MRLCRSPDDVRINLRISVPQAIPESGKGAPRNFWCKFTQFWWDSLGGLAHNHEQALDGEGLGRVDKMSPRHTGRQFRDPLPGSHHVAQE